MKKKRLEHFKSRLQEEREKTINLLEDIEKRQEESVEKIDSQLSTYSNHPADKATEVYMRSQDQGFIDKLQETLGEIDQSLEDMENGRYGYCDNCEKMISEERLEIIPYAKTCLGCSGEGTEDEIGTEFETIENEKLNKSSGDSEENVGYDRQDVYRDVMEDNIVPNDPSYSTGDNIGIKEECDDFEITEEIEDMYYEVDKARDEDRSEKEEDLDDESLE